MKKFWSRRAFIKASAMASISLGATGVHTFSDPLRYKKESSVGIIGLDTSHSVSFTKLLNAPDATEDLKGYKVVAAYPYGSKDIESSVSRIPGYMKEIEELGVKIVPSIKELLDQVDVVLLETNDGRLHLDQALQVTKSGKRLFIDKPLADNLSDAIEIMENSKQSNVPVFSSSSLRYFENVEELAQGRIGKVTGADTFSPAILEKTHSDFFWYGIHGVELLYTAMGAGCKSVRCMSCGDTDIVVGRWDDNRIGTFRGTRSGKKAYGGTVFGEKENLIINPGQGYRSLLVKIVEFFKTGKSPVPLEETLEIYAFMAAAAESKKQNGGEVSLDDIIQKARKKFK